MSRRSIRLKVAQEDGLGATLLDVHHEPGMCSDDVASGVIEMCETVLAAPKRPLSG